MSSTTTPMLPGGDAEVVEDADFVGEGIDAVASGAEDFAQHAFAVVVGGDDGAVGEVLAELADQHGVFAGGDFGDGSDHPLPDEGIAEVAAFAEDFELDPLLTGFAGDDLVGRQRFAGFAEQHGDLAVAGFDAAAVPDEEGGGDQQEDDQCEKYFGQFVFHISYLRRGWISRSHLAPEPKESPKPASTAAEAAGVFL